MNFDDLPAPEHSSGTPPGNCPQARGPNAATRANPAGLTRREMEVLRLLANGCTNAEAARQMHRSEKTVGHHVSAILAKLRVRSRTAAVVVAYSLGMLKPAALQTRPANGDRPQFVPDDEAEGAAAGVVATSPRRSSSGSMRGSWPAKSRKIFIASSLPPRDRSVLRK